MKCKSFEGKMNNLPLSLKSLVALNLTVAQAFNLFLVNKDWARVGSEINNYFWKSRLNHDYLGAVKFGNEEKLKERYKLICTKTGRLYCHESTNKFNSSASPMNDVKNIYQCSMGWPKQEGYFSFLDICGNLYVSDFQTYHKIYTDVSYIVETTSDSVIFVNRQQHILRATNGIISLIWDKYPLRKCKRGHHPNSWFILTKTGKLYRYSSADQNLDQMATKYKNVLDFDVIGSDLIIIYETGLLTYECNNIQVFIDNDVSQFVVLTYLISLENIVYLKNGTVYHYKQRHSSKIMDGVKKILKVGVDVAMITRKHCAYMYATEMDDIHHVGDNIIDVSGNSMCMLVISR